MLAIAIKTIYKSSSNEEASTLINALNLADIDLTSKLHNIFVKETLIHFDQILQVTNIGIWDFQKAQAKKDTAALNLTTRMKAADIKTTTKSTAHAIAKATENIQNEQSNNLASNLRISNLERSLKRQVQQTNELYNIAKKTKTQ
jgi:hypothetical protein